MHDGNSLDIGYYFNDVFDVNTWILWHWDDDKITQISDFLDGVYTRKSYKNVMSGSKITIIVSNSVFDNELSHI